MEITEVVIDGEVYTITKHDSGHIIKELKETPEQAAAKEAARLIAEALAQAKAQAIVENLPSWQEIDDAITAATTIAGLKVIIRKMARVLYWIARDRQD
jgi:predicted house-cleaning NTP pyrophosphatase (Maf/HAM1 superfamily)